MGIKDLASQWRAAAWYDEAPPRIGYHATALGAARSIERGGFRDNPLGIYFASSPEDALKFLALRIATGMMPGGVVGVVAFDTTGLDILEGTDHSPGFFGEDTTSWVTHDSVGADRIYGVEAYQFDTTAARTARAGQLHRGVNLEAPAGIMRRWRQMEARGWANEKDYEAFEKFLSSGARGLGEHWTETPRVAASFALDGAGIPLVVTGTPAASAPLSETLSDDQAVAFPDEAEVKAAPGSQVSVSEAKVLDSRGNALMFVSPEWLPRTAAKRMPAKFPGKCVDCGAAIAKGETMVYDGKVHCTDCKSGRARSQPMIDCPFHGRVPDEGWHEDCFKDWRLVNGSRTAMQVGPSGTNKVFFGLLKDGYHVAPEQDVILAYQKAYDAHDGIAAIGAVAFDSQHLVTIYVLDDYRGYGIAKALLESMDEHVGRQLPDDGMRTRPGAGLLNHLNRPKSDFRKWVGERDAFRPIQRLLGFGTFGASEEDIIAKVFNP